MSDSEPEPAPSRLAELRVSARGWHGVQLAIIGFIGFCGVLQNGRPDNPMWLQVWAGILALAALVLACVATFLVGRVAWPLYGGREPAVTDESAELERDGRRLTRGLTLTFAALAALALGTATGWWPQDEADGGGGALVAVHATNGERWCGSLDEAGPGRLSVSVDGSPVVVSLQDVAAVSPVDSC
jgi:drug/metabolite transporter (DMT)-like permease